jgi:hypothetical protein
MKKREPEIDRPRAYYTSRGERYVKAEEYCKVHVGGMLSREWRPSPNGRAIESL